MNNYLLWHELYFPQLINMITTIKLKKIMDSVESENLTSAN